MPEPTTPVTPEPQITLEALATLVKSVRADFMARYKTYLGASLGATRKAVLRSLLEGLDDSIRTAQGAVNHAYRASRMSAALQGALDSGSPEALANLRDPTTNQPTSYANAAIAVRHVRELDLAVLQIRKATPPRLAKVRTGLQDLDAVLADVAYSPEDLEARIVALEEALATSNATWQGRFTELEARFDQVATGAVAPPTARTAAAKKAAAKKAAAAKAAAKKAAATA